MKVIATFSVIVVPKEGHDMPEVDKVVRDMRCALDDMDLVSGTVSEYRATDVTVVEFRREPDDDPDVVKFFQVQ